MRIWIVNHYAIPPTMGGGTRHFSLASHLIRRGHDVRLVAATFGLASAQEQAREQSERFRTENVDGVPFTWVRTPTYAGNSLGRLRNMLSFSWAMRHGLAAHLGERPDVVLGSSPHLPAAEASMKLARSLGAAFVLEVRDIWPRSLVEVAGASPSHPFVRWLGRIEKRVYAGADHIVNLLEEASTHEATFGVPLKRTTWIPNGIDLSLAPEPIPESEGSAFEVLYAGAHGPPNCLDTLLKAAKLVQDQVGDKVRFSLVGDGVLKAQLKQLAAEQGLTNVSFEDSIPKQHVYERMARANAFVALARNLELYKHGISFNKLFDYMACARPVVFAGSVVGDPVTASGCGPVVPPEDPEALAKAILDLARTSPKRRREMGCKGRSFVEANHDMAALAAKLEAALNAALGSRR